MDKIIFNAGNKVHYLQDCSMHEGVLEGIEFYVGRDSNKNGLSLRAEGYGFGVGKHNMVFTKIQLVPWIGLLSDYFQSIVSNSSVFIMVSSCRETAFVLWLSTIFA